MTIRKFKPNTNENNIGRLFQKEDKLGNTYFAGKITVAGVEKRIMIFRDMTDEPQDWNIKTAREGRQIVF